MMTLKLLSHFVSSSGIQSPPGLSSTQGAAESMIYPVLLAKNQKFDARYWMLGAGALGRPRGMDWGGRREEGSGWGTHVYLWRIHFDIWQI